MNNYKIVDGHYTIALVNDSDILTLDCENVRVTGNLNVIGETTYVESQQLTIQDPYMVLNENPVGQRASESGILTRRNQVDPDESNNYAGLRYDETSDTWQMTASADAFGLNGDWKTIASIDTASAAGNITEIQFNGGQVGGASVFAADANLTYSTNILGISGAVSYNYGVTSSTAVSGGTVGGGGTGLFAYNSEADTTEELVSRTKAIVFGLIF